MKRFTIRNRNKALALLILAAELLFLLVSCGIYGRREPVRLSFSQEELFFSNGEMGFYLDNSNPDRYIATPEFTLPEGLYTVSLVYEKAGDAVAWVAYQDGRFESNLSGVIRAGEGGTISCDFRVAYDDRPMQIRAKGEGSQENGDYLLVREATVTDAPTAFRYFLFKRIVLLLLLDALLLLFVNRKRLWPTGEERLITGALAAVAALSCLPLMVNYLTSASHDLSFHLMRIEGIKAGLEQGMFPVKIQPNLMDGYGYASSVFYGDLFLYIPAILRLFGVSVQTAYQSYIFLVNAVTVLAAYLCFSKMGGRRIGVVCSAVYTLNIYRLSCIYTRAAVGEYTAAVFLPVILYGFWRLYRRAEQEEKGDRSWLIIALGCAGVAICHMISCLTVACFVVLACIVLWKKTFRKNVFVSLLKAAGALVLLTLWFFVPMLDYMRSGVYGINSQESYLPYALEDGAAFAAQLFMGTYQAAGTSFPYERGIAGEMPMTPGIASLLALCLFILFYLKRGVREEKRECVKEGFLCAAFCLLGLFLSTGLVPYTELAGKIELLQLPERAIQYPWRFLSPTGVFLAWLVCILLQKNLGTRGRKELAAAGLLCVAVFQAGFYLSDFLSESGALRVYEEENMSSFEVSNKEYLPVGAEIEHFTEELAYDPDSIQVHAWERDKAAIEVELQNITEEEGKILVPFLYYKGYRAVGSDGTEMEVSQGEDGKVEVKVPGEYEGGITVQFREPWYWRVCEALSLVCLAALLVRYGICGHFGKKRIIS